MLLRVPGLGVSAVGRILQTRRWRKLSLEDVGRLTLSITKMRPFIVTSDWRPTVLVDRLNLKSLVAPREKQLELFAA
jgi:predicted DNA-binding helix-hairpin-helix protein